MVKKHFYLFNHQNQEWEGLWDSEDSEDSYIHSASVGPNGDIIIAGSGCWQVTPCTIEVAGKSYNGRTYGIGWALKVDDEANSDYAAAGIPLLVRLNAHFNAATRGFASQTTADSTGI